MIKNEKIVYTNTDEDMLVKYTYQQFNNRKVQKRLDNTRNLYLFSGTFILIWSLFNFIQKRDLQATGAAQNQSAILPFSFGLLMILLGMLVKPYKKWDIKRNVKKGINSVEAVTFEPVEIEIYENRFKWKNGNLSGTYDMQKDRKSVFAVEDKNYIFVSGRNQLDLVIPKKELTENQKELLKAILLSEES